jgi:hypothetical protein
MDEQPGVDLVKEVILRQERLTPGHYTPKSLSFTIPPNEFRYKDIVIPDYTNGMDILSAMFDSSQVDTGDEICCGKVIIGKIGVLAAPASAGDSVVIVASTAGVLRSTLQDGALDEGFNLSFGVEASTDSAINSGPPTGNPLNPDQELKEYEIKRIGAETDAGGGTYTCAVTLFSTLASSVAAGTDVNIVAPFIKEPIPITKNGMINLGGETLTAGNIPANKRIRFGYKNNGAAEKTIRAVLGMLY